jgi:uncharacterized RDD family membrane protein YckC
MDNFQQGQGGQPNQNQGFQNQGQPQTVSSQPTNNFQQPSTFQNQPQFNNQGGVDTTRHGGFLLRFVAWFIDSLILFVVGFVLGFAVSFPIALITDDSTISTIVSLLLQVVSLVIGWLYFAGLESSNNQGTFGKMILGLIVTDTDGNKVSFITATIRHFAKIISGLLLGIGYLMIIFTEKKQGLHDMIAGTLVLRKK